MRVTVAAVLGLTAGVAALSAASSLPWSLGLALLQGACVVIAAGPVLDVTRCTGRRSAHSWTKAGVTETPDRKRLVVACAAGLAMIAVVLGAAAGGAWQVGASAVTVFATGFVLARATARTSLMRTGRHEADDELTAQRLELARYAVIRSSTDDSIISMALDGTITDWNPGAEQMYGYSREEMLGQPVTILGPAESPDILEAIAEAVAGPSASFETVHLRKDGSAVQVSVILARTCDPAGAASGVVGIARDIGERKAREAEFHQESKLESLGRLSAGLAHEINSPIQFVGDNARFLEEAYEELIRVVEVYRGLLDTSNPIGWMERQERVREAEAGIDFDYLQKEIPSAVEQTLEGIERVSTIVRAMKTFSHPGNKEQVPADLNEALAATITVTRHQISEVADLSLDLAVLPPVRCNIAELNQVFLNLIVNAADAIEETGRRGVITVATVADGDDVVVRISDTGCGIPEDVRPKIFDPFFTTKDVGRGSGQGLPLVRGVVQDGHAGSLTVESAAGQGTTFMVRLPINGIPQQEQPVEGRPVRPRPAQREELLSGSSAA
jgi:PAS domain S-box-containing protein